MGRLILIVGIILIVVGMAAPFFGMGDILGNIGGIMSLATDSEAREEALCEEDETLLEEQGSSTYTQGQGYSSTAILYCVDEEGNKRLVTGELIEEFFGTSNPDEITNMVMNLFSQSMLFVGLSCLGFVMVFVGLIMMGSSRRKNMLVMTNTYGFNPMQVQSPASQAQQGLNSQLQQLEQAYQQNLISREEYDKARQDLLNKF